MERILKAIINCILLLGLFLVSVAQAQEPRLCISPYALQSKNFNYQEYVKQTKQAGGPYVVVWLHNSFGTDFKNPKAELARPIVSGVEVAFLNTTCLNNKNCSKYEILYGYTNDSFAKAVTNDNKAIKQKIEKEAKILADFLLSNLRPDQDCKINTFLEGKLKPAIYTKVTNWIAPFFQGRCEFVWNPQGGNPGKPVVPAVISEGHGDKPKLSPRCIANPDGTTIDDSSYPRYLYNYGIKCEFACAWGPNMNCRSSDGATNQDPRSRTCKDTKDFKKAAIAMKKARGLQPVQPVDPKDPMKNWTDEQKTSAKGCKSFLKPNDGAKKGFILKTADGAPANRRGGTILLPEKIKELKNKEGKKTVIQVLHKGKKIDTYNNSGRYTEDKSNRLLFRNGGTGGMGGKLPSIYPQRVVIKYGDSCWVVEDPTVRVD